MAYTPGSTPVTLFIAVAIFYPLCLTLYRLVLHPLAKFPGPKLAAASYWYECYFNVFKPPGPGQFMYQVEHMHKVYGNLILA